MTIASSLEADLFQRAHSAEQDLAYLRELQFATSWERMVLLAAERQYRRTFIAITYALRLVWHDYKPPSDETIVAAIESLRSLRPTLASNNDAFSLYRRAQKFLALEIDDTITPDDYAGEGEASEAEVLIADLAAALGNVSHAAEACGGQEQEAFETWAKSQHYDMGEHPLHYIFMDPKTNAARDGWNAALAYVRANGLAGDDAAGSKDLSRASGEGAA